MTIKGLFAASAIALACFSAGAAITNLGELQEGDTYLSGSPTTLIQVPNGSFLDTYNFSLGATSSLEASGGAENFWKFSISEETFTYELYDSTNKLLGTGGDEDGEADYAGGFSMASLGSGLYHLNVSGTASGKGGLYNGVMSITAAPVPEPESYAMLLAGLGLMGGIARRRANKKQT